MKKFEKIFLRIASSVGLFSLGACFACGLDYCFDKWVCGGLILSAILVACGFIGGDETTPKDEKGE